MNRIWLIAGLLCLPSLLVLWPIADLYTLGQFAGLSGLSLFCLNIILGSRFPGVERLFGPLNIIYKAHHLLGLLTTTLLITHPLFMALYNPKTALKFLLPTFAEPTKALGFFTLVCLLALISLSVWRKLPYEIWKLTHKFLGLLLFLGAIHGLMLGSTLAFSLPLKVYTFTLVTLALVCYCYHSIFSRWIARKYVYTIASVTPRSSITELVFSPVAKPIPSYLPGQFAFFTLLGETHPFSLTSSPSQPTLSIAAKILGDFTAKLPNVKTGTPTIIEGPYGKFSYLATHRKKQLWIAGGIGITPFLGMARSLTDPSFDITVYYSVKQQTEGIYWPELHKHPIIKSILHITDNSGFLTADLIAKSVGSLTDTTIFICGPLPMMQGLRKQFNKLGISHARIITEEFSLN